jgi:hypothetical protein
MQQIRTTKRLDEGEGEERGRLCTANADIND